MGHQTYTENISTEREPSCVDMELLSHLKHPHPVVVSHEKNGGTLSCEICWDTVSGLSYCCNECVFAIHKWCAELPLEIANHQLHPEHPRLVLLSYQERDFDAVCKDCKLMIGLSWAFSCKECSFFLHPECALLPKQIEFEFHDENCLPVRKELQFVCEGKELVPSGRPDSVNFCQFCNLHIDTSSYKHGSEFFHIQCVKWPKTVKHDNHLHDLTLHVPMENEKYYVGCFCDVCEGERDVNEWLYYCAKCQVAGHLTCGLFGSPLLNKGILTSNHIYTKPNDTDNSDEYMRELEARVKRTPKNEKPLGDLVHFSHKHQLLLFEDIWNQSNTCMVCKLVVYGKVYICYECNFFLHKWCAELPREVHFGFHFQHILTLSDNPNFGCSYCKVKTDGLFYSCLECRLAVHTTCAFLYERTPHKSHHHPLSLDLIKYSDTPPKCNACLFPCEYRSLGCDSCKFYLHVGCSLYPPTGKAETHMHNLNLTCAYKDDAFYFEFICDACEKPRTPNCWVYCCPVPKCNIVAHLDCAVPNLFPTSSSERMVIKNQNDCSSSHDKEEESDRHNDWVYYRPNPLLHLHHGFETPNLDQPIQRILKSDPVYSYLKDREFRDLQKVEKLQHFSHEHLLVLSDEKWYDQIKCKACSRYIYGKTFICHECGYYLHKWCAQIPRELHFTSHVEHPLTLLPGHDFNCCVCGLKDFGFSFSCKNCNFEEHIICALMPKPNKSRFQSHKHPLSKVFCTERLINPRIVKGFRFPKQKDGPMPKCDACQVPCQGMTMECRKCKIYLHVDCAWYPRSIKNEAHDMHTLTLINSDDNLNKMITDSQRFQCDVCDILLTGHHWGYICQDEKCNTTAAHLDCALPNLFLTPAFKSILVDPDQ